MDTNVPPYNTLLVVNELIKANKDFDLLLLPNRNHGFGNEPYMVRRRWDYFVRYLLHGEPPAGYELHAPAGLRGPDYNDANTAAFFHCRSRFIRRVERDAARLRRASTRRGVRPRELLEIRISDSDARWEKTVHVGIHSQRCFLGRENLSDDHAAHRL